MEAVRATTVRTEVSNSLRYQPVFIGGAGRSGTTLLRVMLANHPNLCGGPEFKLTPEIARLYRTMKLVRDVMQHYHVDSNFASAHFREFLTEFFEHFRAEHGDSRLIEKTPHNVLHMTELAEILPDAKFVHVVRDGRDVACSLVKMNWTTPDGAPVAYIQNRENAFKYWIQVVSTGLHQAAQPNLNGKVFLLRYEDLITTPEAVLRALLDFLGEPWDNAVLSYNSHDRRHQEPAESSTEQVAKDLYQTSKARWRAEATAEEVTMFKQLGGELLMRLGYEADLNW